MIKKIVCYQEHNCKLSTLGDLWNSSLSALPRKQQGTINSALSLFNTLRDSAIDSSFSVENTLRDSAIDSSFSVGLDSSRRIVSIDNDMISSKNNILTRKFHETAFMQIPEILRSQLSISGPYMMITIALFAFAESLKTDSAVDKIYTLGESALIMIAVAFANRNGYLDNQLESWISKSDNRLPEGVLPPWKGMQAESLKNVKFIKVPSLPELQRYGCVRIVPATINKIILLVCDCFAWIHNGLFASSEPRQLTQQAHRFHRV